MKKLIYFLFLLTPIFIYSQKEISLENNLTGIYSQSSKTNLGLNYTGANGFYKNHFSLDLNTNYLLKYGESIQENEFLQRTTFDYDKKVWDCFVTHQYNYSLIRKIDADNWIGLGVGLKKKLKSSKISVSYAFMYQNTTFETIEDERILRHSLRLKYKLDNKLISLNTEFFYQPNIYDLDDYIVLGTTKIYLLPERKFNILLLDVINIRTNSSIQVLHNVTIGISYKFKKVYDEKNPSN